MPSTAPQAQNKDMPEEIPTLDYEAERMRRIEALLARRRVVNPRERDQIEARQKIKEEDDNRKIKIRKIESREPKPIEKIADAVIFDWDGTLWDGMENLGWGVVEMAKRYGININLEQFLGNYDQPWEDYYDRHGITFATPEDKQKFYDLYHQILPRLREKLTKEPDIFPEVISTLQELKNRGVKIAIISAEQEQKIRRIVEEKRLQEFIDYIVGFQHSKTTAIQGFCKAHNLDPQRVIMLGDLPGDIREAKNAGIKTAAVARSEIAEDRLGSYDPDYMIKSVGPEIMNLNPYFDEIGK